MDDQTNCKQCGVRILVLTALERGGLCVPCARGERTRIEEGRRRYYEHKAYLQSPPYLFWQRLVKEVHSSGLGNVSEPERHFYAIGVLQGEVFNGGFHQYFSNSSGDDYELAEQALEEIKAAAPLTVLREAKALLFGDASVPGWEQRNRRLNKIEQDERLQLQLSALDNRFCAEDFYLSGLMDQFAALNGFYPTGSETQRP